MMRHLLKMAIPPILLSVPLLVAGLGFGPSPAVSAPDCFEFCCGEPYQEPCQDWFFNHQCLGFPCVHHCYGFYIPLPHGGGQCLGTCVYEPECECEDHPFACLGIERL